jgi:hypothetical protein
MLIIGSAASGGGKPGTPTIGTATATGATTATVAYTAPTYVGKGGTVTYTATSSPGSLTGSSTTTPITVSGLTTGTAYTFTVKATTSYGISSGESAASNSITPANNYSLLATFTSSGNYTIPSGVNYIAAVATGGGQGGFAGGSGYAVSLRLAFRVYGGNGGNSGQSARWAGFKDQIVTPGTNYSVNVGAAGTAGPGGAGGSEASRACSHSVGPAFAA